MRALLTSGIKAILAVAALSTAAHWTLRVQRETAALAVPVASLTDPVATGSIEPRPVERPLAAGAPTSVTPPAPRPVAAPASGLDQSHLAALIAGSAPPKPKVAKVSTKTASADKAQPVEKVAAKR